MNSTDTTTVPLATLDDLDLDAFDAYLRAHIPRLAANDVPHEDALLRLKLAAPMGSKLCPTVAGLYVFGHEPQFALPQLGIVIARFDGCDISDTLIERTDLDGPLVRMHEQALRFIREHSRELIDQIDPTVSASEFPMTAVTEAVANALVHRDLRSPGRVAVRLFGDRLEIWSPGAPSGLPEPVESYLGRPGVSLPRNPLLASLSRQLGVTEQLGRGLALMRRSVEEETQGDLAIRSSKDGVLVTIPSAIDVAEQRAAFFVAN